MRLDVWQKVHRNLTEGVQADQETYAADMFRSPADVNQLTPSLNTSLTPSLTPSPKQSSLLLPIRTLPPDKEAKGVQKGVASLILNQASFEVLDAIADHLVHQLMHFKPKLIIGVPTLGLPLAEACARRLGHVRYIPLSTSKKFWFDEAMSVPLSSITSPDQSKRLYCDPRMLSLIEQAHGEIVVIDDVLSTGRSIKATLELMDKINARPIAIGCAMLQGKKWRDFVRAIPICHVIATPILHKVHHNNDDTGMWIEHEEVFEL